MNKVIILAGPTASGKSSLSLDLAQYFDFEIISADSMAIYKFMDIGTDKPTKFQRFLVKHHMIDVVEPNENYSVYLYSEKAREALKAIHLKGKIPLIVVGTGLYIESFFHSIVHVLPDWDFRNKMYELERAEPGILYEKLNFVDPELASSTDKNNIKRIIRFLEIYDKTQKPPSVVRFESKQEKTNYEFLKLYIDKHRKKLYNNIEYRVDKMIKNGLIEETDLLLQKGKFGLTSSKAIGYRETIDFLNKKIDFNEYVFLLKRNSRRYAKRQISWFKRYNDFIRTGNEGEIFKLIKSFV